MKSFLLLKLHEFYVYVKLIFPLDNKTDVRKGKDYAKLEYITCLDKKLDLNRAFISPKETGSTSSSHTSESPNISTGNPTLSLSLSKYKKMSKLKENILHAQVYICKSQFPLSRCSTLKCLPAGKSLLYVHLYCLFCSFT